MVDFPDAPIDGEIHIEDGSTWRWLAVPGCWEIVQTGTPLTIVGNDTAAGWQVVGDVLYQWGTGTTSASGTVRITFPQQFESVPRVTAVPRFSSAISNVISLVTYDTTVSQISVQTNRTLGNGDYDNLVAAFDWIAVGEAPDSLKKPKETSVSSGAVDADVILLDSGSFYDGSSVESSDITTYVGAAAAFTVAVKSLGSGEFIKGSASALIRYENRDGTGSVYSTSLGGVAFLHYFDGTTYQQASLASTANYRGLLTRQEGALLTTWDQTVDLPFELDENYLRSDVNAWTGRIQFSPLYQPGKMSIVDIRYLWNHYRRLSPT